MVHLGFIGIGHMGSMLIRKFIETGVAAPGDIIASNRTREKAELLARNLGIKLGDNNRGVAAQSDVIFLCVKPLDMMGVLRELRYELTPDKLLISVAGDFNLEKIASMSRARATRVIPSIGSESLKGVSLVVFGGNTTDSDRALILRLFRAIGHPIEVEEKDLDILIVLTSSGPAYISAVMRELVLAATRKGVDADLAERLVKETLKGTSELQAKESFDDLITRVATKGGSTEEGVKAIQKHAPAMFDELFVATKAKHELVRKKVDAQEYNMTQEITVKCQICGKDVPDENCFISEGRTLCEDCYIEVGQRIRVCDPWGERSKRIFRESHGLTGTDGLTDLQKGIYELIKTRGKVTREDLAKEFALKPGELENEFAILRHCQLLKGKKEGDKIYLVLW